MQGGDLPAGLLAEWHRSKRFVRVAQHGDFVVLEMDVLVAGGVSREYLIINLQLWTQMMGQFFLFLRNFTPAETSTAPVVEAASVAEEETVPA